MNNSRKPLLPQILCGLTLCFTLFIFAPIDMYCLNSANFWFTLKDFVPLFLVLFCVAFAAVELVFLGLRLLPRRLYYLALALLAGITVAIYVQGTFLCLTNEVLEGAQPVWSELFESAALNILIWAAILVVFVAVMLMKTKFFVKMVSGVCVLILVMQGTALVTTLISRRDTDTSANYVYYSDADRFTCSQNGDVLLFMVDTLDVRLLDRVQAENPEYLKELEGFTYYHNTSSSYRKTAPSLVSILTGYLFKNERPFYADVTKALTEGTFLQALRENGLNVGIYGGTSGLFNESTMHLADNLRLGDPHIGPKGIFAKNMVRMVLYRYGPTLLQPFVYGEYRTVFNACRETVSGSDGAVSSQNTRIRAAYAQNGITLDNDRRFFKFWKVQGAHTPFNTNRAGEKVPSGSVDIYEQTLGTFTILGEILTGLKESGVYDASTILIFADHGEGWIGSPALLVKYPHSPIEGIVRSDAPVELLDVRATALYGAGLPYEQEGTPVHLWEGVAHRDRMYYAYNWEKIEGFDFYLDTLNEYAVPADAADLDNYKATGVTY